LRVKLASGLGQAESLFSSHLQMGATDWSADGRYITYKEWGSTRIGILELEPEKKTGPLLRTNFAEKTPRFSADGRWLAYSSNETGRDEVYVVSFPGLTQKWKVSTNGGTQPVWRRDGKELFYISPDSKIMAIQVTRRGDTFDFGQPVALVETRIADPASPVHRYDVTPDGQRFIVVSTLQTTAELITVISNWTAGLKK
jgi:Tol biopolymer transport system component